MNRHRTIAALLTLAVLAGSFDPALQDIEEIGLRIFIRLLPDAPETDSRTAVIAIDRRALAAIGPWPWARQRLAETVGRLHRSGATSIGLLVPLDQPQPAPDLAALPGGLEEALDADARRRLDGDGSLADAIRKAGNVILAAETIPGRRSYATVPAPAALREIGRPAEDALAAYPVPLPALLALPLSRETLDRTPAAALAQAAAAVGAVARTTREAHVVSEPLARTVDDRPAAGFALLVALRAAGRKLDEIAPRKPQAIQAGGVPFASSPGLRFFPAPAAGADGRTRLPVHSAADLLGGRIDAAALRGRAVLVGITDTALVPEVYGPGAMKVTPVEWQAFVVDALLAGRAIKVPDWAFGPQRGALLIVGIYLALLPAGLRGLAGLGVSLVVALVVINASLLVMVTRQMWLPLTLPALLAIGGHVLLAPLHRRAREVQRIRNEAADAYRELALNYQAHGRLDEAFTYLCKCPPSDGLLESLYNLGLDFERRRQFGKAATVYEALSQRRRDYRDVGARRERLRVTPQAFPRGTSPAVGATVVIDESSVARPVIGRYVIERELGHGAMGMVYLGNDPKIGRTVAIKTLALTEEFENEQLEEVRRRFYREAETAGQLSHPHIVTIYDVGEEHDLAYIAMDYLQGASLDDHTGPEGLLPADEVFEIGVQVAGALAYAHGRKVVHRDVKPGNIIYDRATRTAKMTDFGIAYLTDNSKTRTGTILGSPAYMSPEQIAGRKVDGRSDLYSLGVTLYELFTGTLPFAGESVAALTYQITHERPESVRRHRPQLPRCLVKILNKALEKDADARYQTGAEFAAALDACRGRAPRG